MKQDLWKCNQWEQSGNLKQICKYDINQHIMSQLKRRSLDSKLSTSKLNRKDSEIETPDDKKVVDKPNLSIKGSKITGATWQTSIKEQLKSKASASLTSKNNKRGREENTGTQKSPPKKIVNCEMQKIPVETNTESTEVRFKELKPEHEELKQQIFVGIKLMLDPIKEDIEQIKIDQRELELETQNITGQKLKQQIIKNQEKQRKLEHRISVLEDQLLEKNIIFQGLTEDEFDDIGDTKSKVISVLVTVSEGATAEDRKDVAKKTPIDSIERMGKFNAHRPQPVKVKFVNKNDVSNLFRNRKKLPEGIFTDREYSKATEKEKRILRPIVKAARKIEEYKGNCRLEGPYLKLNGKRYHRLNVLTLPAKLGPAEITSISDEHSLGFFGELNLFSNFHPCHF